MTGTVISIILHLGLLCSPADSSVAITRADTLQASHITSLKTVSLPSSVLERKTLERMPASNIADAVRYFSGVQIKDYGGVGGLKTVNVRSLGSQHVGVYYNGIRILNAQNGQVDLGRFNLEDVESVTLYHAQKNDLLSAASDLSSASALYITGSTAEKTGGQASFKTGAFGTVNPYARVSYAGVVKARASVSYLYSDGKYRFTYHQPAYDTTATRTNGDIRAVNSEISLSYRNLSLNGYFYNSDRGLPGPVVRRVSDQYSSRDRQKDRTFFVQALWKTALTKDVSAQVSGKYSRDFCRYIQDPSKNAAVMKVDNRYWQSDAFVSAAASYTPFDWLGAGLSTDLRRNGFSSTGEYYSAAPVPSAERLTALAAARMVVSPLSGLRFQASLLYTKIRDKAGKGQVAKTTGRWTPTAALSYDGLRWLNLRAFYKEIFRAPTFNDLYYTVGGRTTLQPEYTRQGDVGADIILQSSGVFDGLKFCVDAFLARVNNKITAVPASNQFRWSMINYGRADIKGVDVSARASINYSGIESYLLLNYSFEDARDHTDRSSRWYGGRLAYSPQHSGSVVSGTSYKHFDLTVSWLYTGVRYRDSANIPDNRLQPWYTTDLSFSWKKDIGLVKAKFCMEMNNMFNQAYEVVSRYPMPGRHLYFKIIINY